MLNKTIKATKTYREVIEQQVADTVDPLVGCSPDIIKRLEAFRASLVGERSDDCWTISFGPHDETIENDLARFGRGEHTSTNDVFRPGQFYKTATNRFIHIDSVKEIAGDDGKLFHIGFSVIE